MAGALVWLTLRTQGRVQIEVMRWVSSLPFREANYRSVLTELAWDRLGGGEKLRPEVAHQMLSKILEAFREFRGAQLPSRQEALLLLGLAAGQLAKTITDGASDRLYYLPTKILASSLHRVSRYLQDGCVFCGGQLCKSFPASWVSRI